MSRHAPRGSSPRGFRRAGPGAAEGAGVRGEAVRAGGRPGSTAGGGQAGPGSCAGRHSARGGRCVSGGRRGARGACWGAGACVGVGV